MLVVQTFFLGTGRGYEVQLASNDFGPRLALQTTDSVAYQDALDLEGTSAKVRAVWHYEGRRQVLDELEHV